MRLRICADQRPRPGDSARIDLPDQQSVALLWADRHEGPVLRAYVNSCPHTGAPLDWQPGQFLTADGQFIQCSLHGALFRRADGLCVHGPCVGQSLTPVDLDLG